MYDFQLKKLRGRLEGIERLCKLHSGQQLHKDYIETEKALNDLGLSFLIYQLKRRGELILYENLEEINQVGGERHYDPIFERIADLTKGLEFEFLDSQLDINDKYLINENSLLKININDNNQTIAYLFCPEGEYREEAKSVFGEEQFKAMLNEESPLTDITDNGPHQSIEKEYPDYIPFRFPIGSNEGKKAWIDATIELLSKSELYGKSN